MSPAAPQRGPAALCEAAWQGTGAHDALWAPVRRLHKEAALGLNKSSTKWAQGSGEQTPGHIRVDECGSVSLCM